jgi:hypothetical protein
MLNPMIMSVLLAMVLRNPMRPILLAKRMTLAKWMAQRMTPRNLSGNLVSLVILLFLLC